jgi:hypothetical protein
VTHNQIKGRLSLNSETWKYGDDGELNISEDDCLKIRYVVAIAYLHKAKRDILSELWWWGHRGLYES